MTDQELARTLGRALHALGFIEGTATAMKDIVRRELGEDYMSSELTGGLTQSIQNVRSDILEAMDAISDGRKEHEHAHPNDGGM